MPNLSLRLKTIASLVPDGARVCDIGTDHGYLAIELKSSGKASSVIAADINPLPLKNAFENIKKSGVRDIELRLCDGLTGIDKDEVDTIIIAGMGGEVIAGIIKNSIKTAKSDKRIILQPTTSPEFLRRFLYSNGFEIKNETPVFENGKIYSVMLVYKSLKNEEKPEYFYYIGKLLPSDDAGILYIKKQLERCRKCALSLKNVPSKQEDYIYYNNIANDIENYLNTYISED